MKQAKITRTNPVLIIGGHGNKESQPQLHVFFSFLKRGKTHNFLRTAELEVPLAHKVNLENVVYMIYMVTFSVM